MIAKFFIAFFVGVRQPAQMPKTSKIQRPLQTVEEEIKQKLREIRDGNYSEEEKRGVYTWISDATTDLFNGEETNLLGD